MGIRIWEDSTLYVHVFIMGDEDMMLQYSYVGYNGIYLDIMKYSFILGYMLEYVLFHRIRCRIGYDM